MSSRRGSGKPFVAANSNYQSSKGKNIPEVSSPVVEQLSSGVSGLNLNSSQNDNDDWNVIARKPKNKAGKSSARPSGAGSNGASGRGSGNAWATQTTDSRAFTGKVNPRPQPLNRGFENHSVARQATVRPPLEHGWNWKSRAGSTPWQVTQDNQVHEDINEEESDAGNEDEALDDTDDDLFSDESDSDASQKSHDTRKNKQWFKKFFDSLDSLTVDEINEPERQWHCPACQNGPGAIDWYRGLQPLITHAQTKGSIRVKLHRELAELLTEELHRRGTTAIPAGEAFGQWKGLKEEENDHEIIWPPMVVIMNTKLEQDENEKWIGMGNQELLDYFNSYAALKARHSYGPQGHRGMSVLIFESSASGYLEAERLDKHFADQETHRDAWNRRRVLFHPGGMRQLYGFMATMGDIDFFNQHSPGKSKVKFERKSYQEMVVKQIKQMSEDNQQLLWTKNRYAREKMHTKALQDTLGKVTEKLRKTAEENRIVRQRTKIQHQQNKEEMDFQDKFFKDQIMFIHEARDAKEENFEKLQQQEREKVKQSIVHPINLDEDESRGEEISKFIEFQNKEMEGFAAKRDKLLEEHEVKLAAVRQRHYEEEVGLEKRFDAELSALMEKYTPANNNNNNNSL